jgi:hypothetical protein
MLLLLGCANQPPQIVTEYEILKLYRKIYVPIDPKLTAPVPNEYVPDGAVDTIDMKVTIQACQARVDQCNFDKAQIATVEGTEATDEQE